MLCAVIGSVQMSAREGGHSHELPIHAGIGHALTWRKAMVNSCAIIILTQPPP